MHKKFQAMQLEDDMLKFTASVDSPVREFFSEEGRWLREYAEKEREISQRKSPTTIRKRPTGYFKNLSLIGQSRLCDYRQSSEEIDREREQPRLSNGYDRDYRRPSNEHAPPHQNSSLQHAQAIAFRSYSENMKAITRGSIGGYPPR